MGHNGGVVGLRVRRREKYRSFLPFLEKRRKPNRIGPRVDDLQKRQSRRWCSLARDFSWARYIQPSVVQGKRCRCGVRGTFFSIVSSPYACFSFILFCFDIVGETAFIVIERNQRKSPCALLIIIRQRVCIPMLLVYKFNEGFIHNP